MINNVELGFGINHLNSVVPLEFWFLRILSLKV